ncbi:MAG TPA: hydroxyisourate hydrolase [Thermoanaerobaculia bacterium]|nr:hydroxyisourate hydrolase [Thermoanaerobaculia bacterium]
MSGITTHVLDTSLGQPASGVPVRLEIRTGNSWRSLARAQTDADGRVRQLLAEGQALAVSTYRLTFDTGSYFRSRESEPFFPEVSVVFAVSDPAQHHHVPLLLSPFGYSTYRGS